ncbi:MAG: hypothetical protein JW946_02315 [Candidatus Omnitrophica bacterium]|nr:hypothetical protein [Candidatus Omnitrophota bacterium]
MPQVNRIYSPAKKEQAQSLRKYGLSLGEISVKLAIPKNTISGWVKGIGLTDIQKKRIKQNEIFGAMKARVLARLTNQSKLETWKNSKPEILNLKLV